VSTPLRALGPDELPPPFPEDPFGGFFADGGGPGAAPPGLLDTPGAHHWLGLIRETMAADRYTFQQTLEGRSGARVTVGGRSMLLLSAYDYLGLIGHPAVEAAALAAVRSHGTGTGGVRLLTGTTDLHRALEEEIAAFKGVGAALTFGSGYMATLGCVPALVGPRDHVLVDEYAHRSTVDACVLARARLHRFAHNDPDALARELDRVPAGRRALVVVEGVYSMDGDVCPLPDIVALKERRRFHLMVDEAHSLGVLGATGRGVDEHLGVDPRDVDLWMGSLSKAIPSNGGYVAGSRELVYYLQHGAAPFMFSAALCPAAVGAARASLRVLAEEPERLDALRRNAARLREGLRGLGYDVGGSESCVVPVVLGDEERTLAVARGLFDRGVLVSAVIHPAVAHGQARLRLCATAAWTAADVEEALDAFAAVRPPARLRVAGA
jgi:8-amino-7-oxononanoate synthase